MVSLVFRITALLFGLVLVGLGVVGLFLPFLQGFLLIAVGLSVMSLGSQRVNRFREGLMARLGERWAWLRRDQSA